MTIAIDIRPLMTAPRTGVGEYTYELLDAIFKIDRSNQYILFYNSWDDVSANIPKWDYTNVQFAGMHYPNKLFNSAMRIFGRPRLDKMVARYCHCERSETERSNPTVEGIACPQRPQAGLRGGRAASLPAGVPRNDKKAVYPRRNSVTAGSVIMSRGMSG